MYWSTKPSHVVKCRPNSVTILKSPEYKTNPNVQLEPLHASRFLPQHEIRDIPIVSSEEILRIIFQANNSDMRVAGYQRFDEEHLTPHDKSHLVSEALRLFPTDHFLIIEEIIRSASITHWFNDSRLLTLSLLLSNHEKEMSNKDTIVNVRNVFFKEPQKISILKNIVLRELENNSKLIDDWNHARNEWTKCTKLKQNVDTTNQLFNDLIADIQEYSPELLQEIMVKANYIQYMMELNDNEFKQVSEFYTYINDNILINYGYQFQGSFLNRIGDDLDKDKNQFADLLKELGYLADTPLENLKDNPVLYKGFSTLRQFSAKNMYLAEYSKVQTCAYLAITSEEYDLFTEGLISLDTPFEQFRDELSEQLANQHSF